MFQAISTAANAMAAQSHRLEALAHAVAAMGEEPPASNTPGNPDAPVRVGELPVGNPVETIVTLKEVELAYRMNAAVIGTAIKMIDSLLEIAGPNRNDR